MEPAQTWISEPDRLAHVALSCVCFYVFIIVLTRISGKRTTGNMNNFDWIITVGIGSILSSGILLRNVSMLDAMLAVAMLAGLQWLTTWAAMRSRRFARWVKPQPRELVRDGVVLGAGLERERMTRDEIHSAIRSAGLERLSGVRSVILETNGQLSVVPLGPAGARPRDPEDDLTEEVAAGRERSTA